jgi:SPP1 gp7 family putative phage head morphogenesis protein
LEHITQNRETICGLLKVPKHELSLQSAGSLGSEEYKIALRNFWESTLKPGMGFIAGSLTKFFQAELGEGVFLQFDIDDVEALKDDMLKKADTATKMLQAGLSVNEVRSMIWDQEPSEVSGANDPYVLVSKTPSFSFPFGGQEDESKSMAQLSPSRSNKIAITPEVEKYSASFVKQLDNEEKTTISTMIRATVDMLVDMTEEAIKVIQEENKCMVSMELKDLPPKRTLQKRISNRLDEKFSERWEGQVAKTLEQSIDTGYEQMLSTVFNEKDREAIRTLQARDSKKRRLLLEARGIESFENINKTHTERIMRQVTEGTKRGESVTNIMRRVADALGTPGELQGKAETIARTETLTAISIGQAAAVDNGKEVIKGLRKVWLSAGDDRVRDSHVEMNGDVVSADEKFSNGLRHPRDINATDPAEVINCRCTLLMLPPGEELEIPK